tara:strand:+ start:507 stop:707 length:201 start_codon:yes stop_codon:yes gene_type:complete
VLGVSLLIGLKSNNLRFFSSLGLALLMAGALATRMYIGDSFLASAPAFVYLVLNLYIFSDILKNKK